MSNADVGEDSVPGRYHVPAVSRAVEVLDLLANRPTPVRLAELVRELGIPRASLFSILATLAKEGMVERDGSAYTIGPRLAKLASSVESDSGLARAARPVAERLVARFGESVQVAVLDGGIARYVEALEGTQTLKVATWVGKRNSLTKTSIGKALILESRDDLSEILGARADAEHLRDLTRDLVESQDRGYTLDEGEGESGVYCVGAPIRDVENRIVAAISVSAPKVHLSVSRMLDMTSELVESSLEISQKLGNRSGRSNSAPA